ncbi:hypothetical protein B0H17DRAFT_1171852 [Mycena rosella]|uniref:Metallo-beta-lactamase domain-containing protein n=1 Tax=Mycena rosella TaxID=1033263 RepID=A0AAD7G4L7_MYCRO|nr:hypothetical protein B0H17DRAFT_1171852 [Mycena rosella]
MQTSPEFTLSPPEASQAFMDVSALEAGIITLPMALRCTSKALLPLRSPFHSASEKQLVFDLGIPRNTDVLPPAVKDVIAKYMLVQVLQDAAESVKKGGLDPADVETVILSHLHFDHCSPGIPTPTSDLLANSVPVDRTRFLAPSEFTSAIGLLPHAMDYFGDGSLYLVDAAGHMSGHINALDRTSASESWIYLGSDTAHDMRLLTGEKEVGEVPDPRTPGAMPGRWYEENKGGSA